MGHIRKIFIFSSLCVLASCKYSLSKEHVQPEPEYHVVLDHCGPGPQATEPIEKPPIITEPHHEPLQILPHPPISPPKVLSHQVYHVQTVLRPKVYQRVITVPRMLRFLRKEVKPVIEHVPYVAKPLLPQIEPPPPIIGLNSALKCSTASKQTPLLQEPPPLNLHASLPKGIDSLNDLFPKLCFSPNNHFPHSLKSTFPRHLLPKHRHLQSFLPTLL